MTERMQLVAGEGSSPDQGFTTTQARAVCDAFRKAEDPKGAVQIAVIIYTQENGNAEVRLGFEGNMLFTTEAGALHFKRWIMQKAIQALDETIALESGHAGMPRA